MTPKEQDTKIARLLETYDMDGLGKQLEVAWTADENRQSLRELATYFNKQLLSQRLEESNIQHVEREVETFYRLLQGEEGSSADRTRIRRRLEREGVDVESLQSDFVSYQAIRTYLKNDRNAEYTPNRTDPLDRETEHLQQLQGRIGSVTEEKLDRLRDSGDITLGTFQVLVSTQVVCEECSAHMSVAELLETGGCDCSEE